MLTSHWANVPGPGSAHPALTLLYQRQRDFVHLWGHVAQVEGVVHGLLSPLVIGRSSQVTSIKATPPVVGVGGSVEHVHTGDGGHGRSRKVG